MPTLELPTLRVARISATTASTRPVLINRDPAPDEVDVPLDSTITLHIVDPGMSGMDREATRIWINGVLAFEGVAAQEIKPGFDGPASAHHQDFDTLAARFDLAQPFTSEAFIKVRVVSATLDGHALDEVYRFTTEDRTSPKATSAQAISPKAVRVGFDEPILAPNSARFLFTTIDAPAVPLSATVAHTEGAVLVLNVTPEMTPGARYRLVLEGVTDRSGNVALPPTNEVTFTGFRPAQPAERRFDLWEMLPTFNQRQDHTGDLRRFIASLQEVTDLLLVDIDRFPDIFDLERAPEPFLDLILHDQGNPFSFDLDALGKRRLAAILVEMYRQKGTAIGIQNAVRFFLGVEVTAVRPYADEALALGDAQLGLDWVLGPSERFARYAFDVEVGVPLSDTQREQLRTLVEYLKPAHTHFMGLVEPTPPAWIDHWELNASELGVSTDLH